MSRADEFFCQFRTALSNWSRISDWGFELDEKPEVGAALGRVRRWFSLVNSRTGRRLKILIGISESEGDLPSGTVFLDNGILEEGFVLDHYLKQHFHLPDPDLGDFRRYQGNNPERVTQFLTDLEPLVEKYVVPLLNGAPWPKVRLELDI